MKGLESTVIRCIQLIEAFDALEKGMDWADVPSTVYRRVLGNDHYTQRTAVIELWNRYQSGRIYAEVLSLYDNLPPAAQNREEIHVGISAIRRRMDQPSKRRADGSPPRRGRGRTANR